MKPVAVPSASAPPRPTVGCTAPLHHHVIFPADLWTYQEVQRNEGHDNLAIPHNGNVSDGWMFSPNKFHGGPMDARYAQRRQLNEPLFEMIQTKGASETHPWLSPNDEFAGFELFPNMINVGKPSAIKYGYVRQALADGLRYEEKLGTNPFKFGIVAGADVHSSYSGNEEFNWHGAHGKADDTPKRRLDPTPNPSGEAGAIVGSAGTTAVWAEENTRMVVPDIAPQDTGEREPKLSLDGIRGAGRMPVVWLQAVIVVCAYAGYKSTDDFSLLARDALGFDEVAAAGIGTLTFWIRAIVAVAAGYLADRVDSSRVIAWGFAILIVGSGLIASGVLFPGVAWMLIATIVTTSVGVYALRGVYFALFAEGAVPLAFTGSAVGVVSLIGFTPDVFMGPLMGVLLDNSPGVLGHQHVFASVAVFGAVGLMATYGFRWITVRT